MTGKPTDPCSACRHAFEDTMMPLMPFRRDGNGGWLHRACVPGYCGWCGEQTGNPRRAFCSTSCSDDRRRYGRK